MGEQRCPAMGTCVAPRVEPPSLGGHPAPKPIPQHHGRQLGTPSRAGTGAAWTKPGALQFLEGEAGSKGTDPASHAPGLRLHFPEAGERGTPKLAGD